MAGLRRRFRALLLLLCVNIGLALFMAWHTYAYAQGPPRTRTAIPTPSPTAAQAGSQVALYERLEWTLPITQTYENPFDPAEIDVVGVFTAPDGSQLLMPAFWMQPMVQTCTEDCAIEVLEPDGPPEWRLRFTPDQVGPWTYTFEARTEEGTVVLEQGRFEALPSDAPGFIRVAENGRYFEFGHTNAAFLPIGHNLAWSWDGAGGVFAYERWLRDLAANGGNFARLYVDTPWFIGFEWASPVGDYTAAQEDFWRLDTILEVAAEEGIYLDVVVLWHQALANYRDPPVLIPEAPARVDARADWDRNPYNVLNGGWLTSTTQFFTDETARARFQRRLRYLVARWGYSPHVFAWDLLSAADRVLGYNPELVLPWLQEMSDYLRQVDPYDHLVTVGAQEPSPELITAPGIDFGQVRFYQRRPLEDPTDQVLSVWRLVQDGLRLAARPLLLTEFSLSPWYEPTDEDPTGVHVRNTLWTSLLSGAAGAGASWWWDTYIEPQGLTALYAPLAQFSADIPWNRLHLVPVQARLVSSDSNDYGPLRLDGFDRRFTTEPQPDMGAYSLTPDGAFPDLGTLSSYIFGMQFNPQLHRPQAYLVAAPVDTRLTVGVGSVSPQAGATLAIRRDGVDVAEVALSPGASSVAITVPLPAGEHRLELDNVGDDWLQIDFVSIAHYIAPLRVLALADHERGLLLAWFQNRTYSWQQAEEAITVVPPNFRAAFSNMPPGEYRVEFWDPFSGQVIGEDRVRVRPEDAGNLTFELLPIERMLAVRAIPVGGLNLPTLTPTPTRPTVTPQPSPTGTATPSPSRTARPTRTATPTMTRTPSPTASPTPSATATATDTPSPTATASPTDVPTRTPTRTPSATPSSTASPSATPTATRTARPSRTPTPTVTPTTRPTETPSRTPTVTRTPSITPSPRFLPIDPG